MSKKSKELTGLQKVLANTVAIVFFGIILLVVGVGVIKFLQWAF